MAAKLTMHTENILFSKHQRTTKHKCNLSQNLHELAKCVCSKKMITGFCFLRSISLEMRHSLHHLTKPTANIKKQNKTYSSALTYTGV